MNRFRFIRVSRVRVLGLVLPCVALCCIGVVCPLPQPEPRPPAAATHYTYRIVNKYDHDTSAFTQGLVYDNGVLYEGTGNYGKSDLRRVTLETGAVELERDLASDLFGEGIALFDNRLYQLTWKAGRVFLYDSETFDPVTEYAYDTQGWGLTQDGAQLIMSDGTSTLTFRDPYTFEVIRTVTVRGLDGAEVDKLNELEYIDGSVYANVWLTNYIVIIDPESGNVTARIDLTGLLSAADRGTHNANVLNGIAYDAEGQRLFVTGKWWPKLYHIELVAQEQTN